METGKTSNPTLKDSEKLHDLFFASGEVTEIRAMGLSGKNPAWNGFARDVNDRKSDKPANIRRGYFKIARVLYEVPSAIWLKPPLYLKLLLWIVGEALYEPGLRKGFPCERGEFVTQYDEIRKALAYKKNRELIVPSKKQIRVMLEWMQCNDIITYRGVKKIELPNRGTPKVRTGYYVATHITVVNYDTYQSEESYKGPHKEPPKAEQGQTVLKEVKKEKEKDSSPSFSEEEKGPKQGQLNPQVEELLDYCRTAVKQHDRFDSELTVMSKDRAAMSKAQRKWPPDLILTLFEFHLDSWKADNGPSLSAAFSEDSYNSFTQEWKDRRYAYGYGEDPIVDGLQWWEGESREEQKWRAEHGQGRRQKPRDATEPTVKEDPKEAQAPKEEPIGVDVPPANIRTPEEEPEPLLDLRSLYSKVESIQGYFRGLCKRGLGINIGRRKSDAAYLRNNILPKYVGKDYPTFRKGIKVMNYAIERFRNLSPRPTTVKLEDCFTEEIVNSYFEEEARKTSVADINKVEKLADGNV
jgi:hypothetical protein